MLRSCFLLPLLTSAVLIKTASCSTLPNADAELSTLKYDMKQQFHTQGEQIKQLQDTLSKLVVTLLGLKRVNKDDDGHVIKRRKASADEDLLSNLPIDALAGLRGKDGRDGKDGICKDGRDGKDGICKDGRDGKDGESGKDGRDGVTGKDGKDGNDGAPGSRGAHGLQGKPGKDGAAGLPGPRGSPGAGAVYTRWGRTTCANSSTLIYHGFAGGNEHEQTGGGVNYQCLPRTPEYNSYRTASRTASIAGVEYQSQANGIFPNAALNQNVPCARCCTNSRSAVMMLPAKRSCPSGWTKEYEGYLMTEVSGQRSSSTYECVDADPEYIRGLHGNANGALFYFVKPTCSGTGTTGHCPPYRSNAALTCVVCSK